MRELRFEITFKSPVILQASSNTQGKMSSLDFIPGSAFWVWWLADIATLVILLKFFIAEQ